MGPRAAVLAAGIGALAGLGCAPATVGRAPLQRSSQQRVAQPGARAKFDPALFEDVFARAVHAVRQRGHELAACDAEKGALTTSAIEFEAPCGETICLTREFTAVRLGFKRARVTVMREVWDPAVRAWRASREESTEEEAAQEERELLSVMIPRGAPQVAASHGETPDPCVPSGCGADGSCLTASADPVR